jgi:hypothetical protein
MQDELVRQSFDKKGLFFMGKLVFVFIFAILISSFSSSHSQAHTPQPSTHTEAFAPLREQMAASPSEIISTETLQIPLRTIKNLTIDDMVPVAGKFIAADLASMQMYLFEDGTLQAQYPIKSKGRPGTHWETPAGLYKIQTKEETHFSSIGKVYMPYSMQFYGNYFIHGWTYYPDGTETPYTFSGGCIKLDTGDAEKVFEFADINTPLFVYDPKDPGELNTLVFESIPPEPYASSWLIADIDTGEVYAEHNADISMPLGSVQQLLTALVANETISVDKKIAVPEGSLLDPPNTDNYVPKIFAVHDLFYPLLMRPTQEIVDALSGFHGTRNFVRTLNATARSLDMASTTITSIDMFENDNTTTAEDLYRLAWYITNKKSFVWNIAETQHESIYSIDGSEYDIARADIPPTISIVHFPVGEQERRIAVITLNSTDQEADMNALRQWVMESIHETSQTACVACGEKVYRKIEL